MTTQHTGVSPESVIVSWVIVGVSAFVVPQGEIDVLLWGHESRLTYAVEVETGWTDTTLYDKTERYVHSVGPIDDIVPIEVTEMPINMIEATEWISEQLGLTL